MQTFFSHWHDAAMTTLGLFWMAFWAFALGYLISSMVQVFVTRERMQASMGEAGPRSVGLATFFGFISSSCSFAALATTRALFAKGAAIIPSLAFLLASTNLVIELGIVIAIFLSWQFVVGEYLGALLLILLMWLVVKVSLPKNLEEEARKRAQEAEDDEDDDESSAENWKQRLFSKSGWRQVASRYVMEWHMVWRDVTVGFTVAGIIAAFVPQSFFQSLFVGAGDPDAGFLEVLLQCIVGPIAAFFTFIGSMGNIPLAAVLFGNGVAFAGIMAFIFSDLVVFPVLRIQAEYYGWKMALYILAVFLLVLIATALILHYGFAALDLLPDSSNAKNVVDRDFFKVDYTLFLNIAFLCVSSVLLVWRWRASGLPGFKTGTLKDWILLVFAAIALLWLALGTTLPLWTDV